MRKIIIGAALLLLSGCNDVQAGADISQPLTTSDAVERDRFEVVDMSGFIDKIITDRKSGCQYMVVGGNGWSIEPLGCYNQYKTKSKE